MVYELKVSIKTEEEFLKFWEDSQENFDKANASVKANDKAMKVIDDNSEEWTEEHEKEYQKQFGGK